jgi:hypothetical protein
MLRLPLTRTNLARTNPARTNPVGISDEKGEASSFAFLLFLVFVGRQNGVPEAGWSQALRKLVKRHAVEQQRFYNVQPNQKPGIECRLVTEDFTDRTEAAVFPQ